MQDKETKEWEQELIELLYMHKGISEREWVTLVGNVLDYARGLEQEAERRGWERGIELQRLRNNMNAFECCNTEQYPSNEDISRTTELEAELKLLDTEEDGL